MAANSSLFGQCFETSRRPTQRRKPRQAFRVLAKIPSPVFARYPNLLYLVDSMRFEIFIGFVIAFNCVTIGVQTNMRGNTVFVIDLMDQFFTLVFVLEVVLRSLVPESAAIKLQGGTWFHYIF